MEHAITFDTYAYVKKLKAVGFTEEQAEVQAETMVSIIGDQVATRQDLKGLGVTLRADLKELEVTLKADLKELDITLKADLKELDVTLRAEIAKTKAEIIKWVAGMLVAQAAIVATLVKLL